MKTWVWIAAIIVAIPVCVFGQSFVEGLLRDASGNLVVCGSCHVNDASGYPTGPNGEVAVQIIGGQTPTPGVTPTPTPPPTPAPSEPPVFNGCNVFPATDVTWNVQLSSPTVDPNNANYMTSFLTVAGTNATVATSHSTVFWFINKGVSGQFSTGPLIYTGDGSTVQGIATAFMFDPSYNWQDKGVNANSDHHLMVVQPNCTANEGYANNNEATVGASFFLQPTPSPVQVDIREKHGIVYTLTSAYPTPAPTGATNPYAGGTQLLGITIPGMVRWDDFIANTPHAIVVDVPTGSMQFNTFVYPAHNNLGTAFRGTGTPPPLGARAILPAANVPAAVQTCINNGSCPQTAFIVECMELQGVYLGDQGAPGFTIRLANTQRNGVWVDPWNTTDLANLALIKVSAFNFIVPPYGTTSIANCQGLLNPSGC